MPTRYEFQELCDNCTSEWTSINDVEGCLFTSNINGKSVFFPASGSYNGTNLGYHGTRGNYWSSSYNSEATAYYLNFSPTATHPQYHIARPYGFPVRAVRDP